MTLAQEFVPLKLEELHREAAIMKTEGWRFIETHAVNTDDGVDLYYAFMKDGLAKNYRVAGVQPDDPVPSITDMFLAAFVFENEARELFGVNMQEIAIDFDGAMYAPAQLEPMTIISPEQKAAREKAKKAAAAKAQKESAPAEAKAEGAVKGGFVMTPERRARLDAKLATMSPEKVAKVEAALKAREAEAAAGASAAPAAEAKAASASDAEKPTQEAAAAAPAQASAPKDAALEAKLATMSPEKAAKVRAALEGKTVAADAATAEAAASETADAIADGQLNSLVNLMSDEKAAIVRKALNMKEGQ